jgi:hypothetical protein
MQSPASLSPVLRALTFSVRWALSAPRWMLAWAHVAGTSLGAVIGVGALLGRQLVLLASGGSYLSVLQEQRQQGTADGGGAGAAGGGGGRGTVADNFRRVFGQGHPLMWVLPDWGPVDSEECDKRD